MLCLSYEDAVTEDYFIILQQVLAKGIDQRRQLSKQFIKAFDLPSDEVRTILASFICCYLKVLMSYHGGHVSWKSPRVIENWKVAPETARNLSHLKVVTSNVDWFYSKYYCEFHFHHQQILSLFANNSSHSCRFYYLF